MSASAAQPSPQVQGPFPHPWTASILARPPLIAPVRQFVYPLPVPGEEDALARGAMLVEVKPPSGGAFLLTCALGFRDPRLPTGVWSCPHPDHILAVAGGYAYLADTTAPDRCTHLELRPVTTVLAAPEDGLLLLAGFHTVTAIGREGVRWTTDRLSWEGVTLSDIRNGHLHGLGWNMMEDREVPFSVDLETGRHTGGGFTR